MGSWCRACATARTREYRVIRDYGITREDIARMREEQGNRCGVCTEEMTRACVDHNHATGKVRGLLCSECNLGIGKFRDDPVRLVSAAAYLIENDDLTQGVSQ